MGGTGDPRGACDNRLELRLSMPDRDANPDLVCSLPVAVDAVDEPWESAEPADTADVPLVDRMLDGTGGTGGRSGAGERLGKKAEDLLRWWLDARTPKRNRQLSVRASAPSQQDSPDGLLGPPGFPDNLFQKPGFLSASSTPSPAGLTSSLSVARLLDRLDIRCEALALTGAGGGGICSVDFE